MVERDLDDRYKNLLDLPQDFKRTVHSGNN